MIMIALSVRFPHGWARAAGRGDLALMGSLSDSVDGGGVAEWPLSPARLFAALVAAGGTGRHRRVSGDDSELLLLEESAPPLIIADPPQSVLLSALNDRFVIKNERQKEGSAQEFVARTNALSRPGIRMCPRHPELVYVWPGLDMSTDQLRSLSQRAARVGYLGAADSPAIVRVADEVPIGPAWIPSPDGSAVINVPYDGLLEVLDVNYEQFVQGGAAPGSVVRRQPVTYRPPGGVRPERRPEPIMLWTTLDKTLAAGRVVALAEAVRSAVLAQFGRRGSLDEAPAVLHGHGLEVGAQRARYWPLPRVDRYGKGRLVGVCVSLPHGTGPTVVQRVQESLDGLAITLPGGTKRLLSTWVDQPGTFSAGPSRWRGPSSCWVSATPVVFDRYRRGGPNASDIAEMCRRESLPEPVDYEIARPPLVPGAVDLQPWQTTRRGTSAAPYAHVRLWFDRPVDGPFALGRMRSFGLGLMSPDTSTKPATADTAADGAHNGSDWGGT